LGFAEHFFGDVGEEAENFFSGELIGAGGGDEGQEEADTEVQDEHGGNTGGSADEPAVEEPFLLQGGTGQGQLSGGEGDVTHVEGRTEESAQGGGEAEEHAEGDVGSPAGHVPLDDSGDLFHAGGANDFADGMIPDGLGQAVVDGEIVKPAPDQTGHPKDDAGQRGEKDGAAVEGAELMEDFPGGFQGEVGMAKEGRPGETEKKSANGHHNDVADGGSDLGLADAGAEIGNLVTPLFPTLFPHDVGEMGGGHGGLLGGQNKTEGLHEEEADGVVQAIEKGFRKRGKVELLNGHFNGGGAGSEQSPTRSGNPDMAVFLEGVGDVVLPGLTGAVDDFPVQEGGAAGKKITDAAIVQGGGDEFVQEAVNGGVPPLPRSGGHDLGHAFHAAEAEVHDFEADDDFNADALTFEAFGDEGGFLMAAADVFHPGQVSFGKSPTLKPGRDEGLAGRAEFVKGRSADTDIAAALAQGLGEAVSLDAGGQKPEAIGKITGKRLGDVRTLGRKKEVPQTAEDFRGKALEFFGLAFARKEPAEQFFQALIVAGLGKNAGDDTLPEFGKEAAVAGDAGGGEEIDALGNAEDALKGILHRRPDDRLVLEDFEKHFEVEKAAAFPGGSFFRQKPAPGSSFAFEPKFEIEPTFDQEAQGRSGTKLFELEGQILDLGGSMSPRLQTGPCEGADGLGVG